MLIDNPTIVIKRNGGGGQNFMLYNVKQILNEDGTSRLEISDYDPSQTNENYMVGQVVNESSNNSKLYIVDKGE